ncbi:MAG TPA: hypothetical protein VK580_12055 [Steroidobacteraceae bacterium]|nr:hypothetical protein [Steroidobacteraceae bacterium]
MRYADRPAYHAGGINQLSKEDHMDQAQLIQAAASIAGGMAAAHYDKFSGLVATRITDIAETAVKIARAIDAEARKQQ